jgi:hypothetical protein
VSQPTRPSIRELLADKEALLAAFRQGVQQAVLAHARAGNPVATWRDGQVVWIPPEEILARFAAEGAAVTAAAPATAP